MGKREPVTRAEVERWARHGKLRCGDCGGELSVYADDGGTPDVYCPDCSSFRPTDEAEFIEAMAELHGRCPFPPWSAVLQTAKDLGWTKAAQATPCPADSMG